MKSRKKKKEKKELDYIRPKRMAHEGFRIFSLNMFYPL